MTTRTPSDAIITALRAALETADPTAVAALNDAVANYATTYPRTYNDLCRQPLMSKFLRELVVARGRQS